tara:strand:+ start:3136 stop:3990 length:855 start_codon:yes stop_codon:yes gene_type:complete
MKLLHEVHSQFATLTRLTAELGELLLSNETVKSLAFDLPPREGVTDNEWLFIDPIESEGFTALTKSIAAYQRFTPHYAYSPKYPFRLPGVIQLPSALENDTMQLVAKCNYSKTMIKLLLVESGQSSKNKRDLMQSILPNAITLQIYRHILTFPTPIKRIGFTWCNKYSVKTFSFLDMLSYLENSKNHPPAGTPKDQWLFFVEQEIATLKRRPKDDIIKLKRPLPAIPMANINFDDDRKGVMRHAHLPFITFGDEPIAINPLKKYMGDAKKDTDTQYMIRRLYAL